MAGLGAVPTMKFGGADECTAKGDKRGPQNAAVARQMDRDFMRAHEAVNSDVSRELALIQSQASKLVGSDPTGQVEAVLYEVDAAQEKLRRGKAEVERLWEEALRADRSLTPDRYRCIWSPHKKHTAMQNQVKALLAQAQQVASETTRGISVSQLKSAFSRARRAAETEIKRVEDAVAAAAAAEQAAAAQAAAAAAAASEQSELELERLRMEQEAQQRRLEWQQQQEQWRMEMEQRQYEAQQERLAAERAREEEAEARRIAAEQRRQELEIAARERAQQLEEERLLREEERRLREEERQSELRRLEMIAKMAASGVPIPSSMLPGGAAAAVEEEEALPPPPPGYMYVEEEEAAAYGYPTAAGYPAASPYASAYPAAGGYPAATAWGYPAAPSPYAAAAYQAMAPGGFVPPGMPVPAGMAPGMTTPAPGYEAVAPPAYAQAPAPAPAPGPAPQWSQGAPPPTAAAPAWGGTQQQQMPTAGGFFEPAAFDPGGEMFGMGDPVAPVRHADLSGAKIEPGYYVKGPYEGNYYFYRPAELIEAISKDSKWKGRADYFTAPVAEAETQQLGDPYTRKVVYYPPPAGETGKEIGETIREVLRQAGGAYQAYEGRKAAERMADARGGEESQAFIPGAITGEEFRSGTRGIPQAVWWVLGGAAGVGIVYAIAKAGKKK